MFNNFMVFQHKASGLGTNRISYKIFDIRHVSKAAAHFQKRKQNVHIFIQVPKRRKWKNIRKRGCRTVLNTLPNTNNGAFLHYRCLLCF